MKCSVPGCGKELSQYNPNDKCWSHFVEPDEDWGGDRIRKSSPAHGTNTDRPFIITQAMYQGSARV
jgi:hypothetical protein